MNTAPKFTEWMTGAQDTVAAILAKQKPDGDLLPMVLAVKANGKCELIPIEGQYLANARRKDGLAAGMAEACEKFNVVAWMFICMAYVRRTQARNEEEAEAIEEETNRDGVQGHPDAVEIVMIQAVFGDNAAQLLIADVVRTPDKAPCVTDWEVFSAPSMPARMGGRFVDAVQPVVASNWKKHLARA